MNRRNHRQILLLLIKKKNRPKSLNNIMTSAALTKPLSLQVVKLKKTN
jgi:hypothetical protein